VATNPEAVAIPEYPFWQADELAAVFGADALKYAALTKQDANAVSRLLRNEERIFSDLFFNGGSLAQHGLRWKPEIAEQKPHLTLRALMCSFEPSHEVKTATVALALHHWCEPVEAQF
jgi:hypothetical protein